MEGIIFEINIGIHEISKKQTKKERNIWRRKKCEPNSFNFVSNLGTMKTFDRD